MKRIYSVNVWISVGFVIMWSSGFIGARLGAHEAGTYPLLMWRFVIAAAILVAVQLFRRTPRMSPRDIVVQIAVGILGVGGIALGTVKAIELGVGAGTVALIAALQPIVSSAVAGPVLGEQVSRRQWAGLIVGLAGVALVVGGDLGRPHDAPWWAFGLPFAGMAGLVAATMLERRAGAHTDLTGGLTVQCVASAVLFTVLSLVAGEGAPPGDGTFWLAVGWFAVSIFGGYGFYWLGVRRMSIARMTSLIYLTPPTIALWALLMFGDRIAPLAIVGMAVCLLSVLLALQPESEPEKVPEHDPASELLNIREQ
ncbi:DMT family transporter [Nocardia terpenica]|uniref:DMT family transporter n=1 Tax=Nocardia terpenica TaxID=455432 RepID=UPI0003147D7F|nr:DMT family transporter [Nocardia terpenica]NQE91236.1 DMT family transporter [Nocardia terpenica]